MTSKLSIRGCHAFIYQNFSLPDYLAGTSTFRALAQKSSESLEQHGITAADRAVLEFLYPDLSLSVPEIAERYQVTRQHVQVTVNTLLAAKLVTTRENPRHKRSPLIRLNKTGRALFDTVIAQDQQTIKALFSGLSAHDIKVTKATLHTLLNKI